MAEIKPMNLTSEDLVADRVEQMKKLFPEITTEGDGSIDFEKLRLILGDEVDEGDERYAFTWPGKADAIRQAQTVSTATLRPCPEKSVNWDTTQNLYIEGDNLEVLKLLQRGYHGKVKMIYIDPPYNTGHDFVYHDSFGDSIENYKEQAGLSGQSNADTSGRFHSNWCSMMYPRLKLARELLRDDGFLLVSIDDNELRNLISLCDELFGNRNCLGILQWHRRQTVDSRNQSKLSRDNEYIAVYGKSELSVLKDCPIDESKYSNPDNDPRGPWASIDLSGLADASRRPNLHFDIVDPATGIKYPPNPRRGWSKSRETIQRMIEEKRILFPDNPSGRPREKKFLSDLKSRITSFSTWLDSEEVGFTTQGSREVASLFEDKVFDFPKPVALVRILIEQCSSLEDEGAIILDFFSGSATTAQAMFSQCELDNLKRRFIHVQLPEVANEIGRRNGFETLCDLGEERIRRAGNKIAEEVEKSNRQLKLGEEPKQIPDIGFRVLKLDESGIVRPEPGQLMLDRVKLDRTDEDIIFEMMLKWGLELTYSIEKTEVAGYPCYSVAGDALICCMREGLTIEAIQAIADRLPSRVLMLDSILDDTLKLNAVQIFKHAEEKHQVTIDLRTV